MADANAPRPYLQHGSRHRKGGSDPIEGFSYPVVAYGLNGTTQTVPHGTTTNCSFASTIYTSDSTQLAWSTTTTTNDTLSIVGSGFAQLVCSARWPAGTLIDFKINTGSGFEVFDHDGFTGFSGHGTASASSLMPTIMDICWIDTTASPSLPVFVKMTNADGSDNGPVQARLGCIFYPGLT